MRNIIVFGPPGSGKGTQSRNIIERYGLAHLSTGELLRKEIAAGTPCGKMADERIAGGNLVPDDVVLKMAMRFAMEQRGGKGVVFDGFPRTLRQAELLDRMMRKRNIGIDLVMAINITEEEIYNRIMSRSIDSGRADDKYDIVTHRIDVYLEQTYPVIEYYNQQNKLAWVSGMAPVKTVFGRICDILDERFPDLIIKE